MLLFLAAVICSAHLTALAHSGRTDSQGGHYDSATGEYHFHHGYPAHQHVNGVCPYDFADRTDEESDAGGGNRESPHPPAESGHLEQNQPDRQTETRELLLNAIAGCFFLFAFCAVLAAIDRLVQMYKFRKTLLRIYSGKSISQLAGVPDDVEMDSHGMPHSKGCSGRTKDRFLVYVTKTGKAYHTASCAHLKKSFKRINICEAKAKGMSPCAFCRPAADVPEWATEYRRLLKLQTRYRIPMKP